MRSPASLSLAVAAAAFSVGCHVYNSGSYDLAKQVQKDYLDLHIDKGIDDELNLSDQMLKSELQAARKYDEAVRDNHLAILLEAPIAITMAARSCEAAAWSEGQAGSL